MLKSITAVKSIWVALNLLILYFTLKKFLFKPVTEFMDNRARGIKESIENAEKNRAEAQKLKESFEEQIKNAKLEADKIIEAARAKAEKEYDSIVSSAKQQAEALLVKAREEIDRERQLAMREMKAQVAGLALAAASKVLEANMENIDNRLLVEKFIDEAGAA
ncbi:MAG: F0F1 ATP synthase subunit B [Clostridia bacterium]|nr:F0F1 ATP synthase subunit B [Clostridia bacterium]